MLIAAFWGHAAVLEKLISNGAHVNFWIKGNSPLDKAMKGKSKDVLDVLKKHDAMTCEELKAKGVMEGIFYN